MLPSRRNWQFLAQELARLAVVLIAMAGCASPWTLNSDVAPEEAHDEALAESSADDAEASDDTEAATDEPKLPDREVTAKLRRDLSSPQATARIAALQKLVDSPPTELPAEVVEARSDPDPRVRVKALEVVAAVVSAETFNHLARGLRDESRDVRHAAMRGLGRLKNDEAQTKLRELWEREPETTRVVLVEALANAEDVETLLKATEDKVWQVRAAAAPALARLAHDTPCVTALERLAADASSVVQAAAVDAVAVWPLDDAGGVWLAAMEHGGMRARLAAQRAMSRQWPPAEMFDPEADRDLRIRRIVELRGQWQSKQVAARQRSAPSVSTATDAIRPQVEQALNELAGDSLAARRQGAQSLAVQARREPLGPAACRQLNGLLAQESDAAVWRGVLDALSGDASNEATSVALLATGHEEGDIRRRACGYLAAHPTPEAAAKLTVLLQDQEVTVQRAAAEALGGCANPEDCQALVEALGSRDGPLRVAAAISLSRLDISTGLPALERLAHDADLNVRLAAVRALGEMSDPAAQGALVDLLDESHGVGVAALRSLRKSAEDETSGATPVEPGPQAAEIAQWKRWWRERPSEE